MRTVLDYYPIALAEGEGAGTAYEYYVKARALRKVLKVIGAPRSLLIYSLPEHYGFSLDFLLLAQDAGCSRIVVTDERPERLEQFKQIYSQLTKAGQINLKQNLEFSSWPVQKGDFDLFVSCEVLQRLSASEQQRYWQTGLQMAKAGVVFTPNADNPDHAAHSGLKTVNLQTLRQQALASAKEILADGYLDMPPFPPGIKRSEEQRQSAGQGLFRLAFWGIEQWAKLENCVPLCKRKKSAHIVFVAARR